MTLHFGILVFPQIQLLDLVGPYEVFSAVPGARVDLIWKDLSPPHSSSSYSTSAVLEKALSQRCGPSHRSSLISP